MKARIAEVFDSIQGEGIYVGEKQLLVRFFGCNLRCRFCDTQLHQFMEYEPQELFGEIVLYPSDFHSISFTGGEPLLQKDFLKEVLILTHNEGYKNYLETNGTLPGELEDVIGYLDIVAIDLKLPTSTGMGYLWGLHRKFLKIAAQKEVFLKAVICRTTQEEDLREMLKLIKETEQNIILVLQPNSYENDSSLQARIENFRDICIQENIATCILPQVHKVIGLR